MADSNKTNKSGGNVGGAIGVAIGLISVATPVIVELIDKVSERVPKQKDIPPVEPLLTVPELYTKGFPLTIEQAKAKLESEGFNIIPSPLMLNEAKAEYRKCFDGQVVSSQPKSKSREKAGTMVVVRYVTQEIIDESQKIFDNHQKQKSELKEQKTAKREKQRAQLRQVFNDVSSKLKRQKEPIEEQSDLLDISDHEASEPLDE